MSHVDLYANSCVIFTYEYIWIYCTWMYLWHDIYRTWMYNIHPLRATWLIAMFDICDSTDWSWLIRTRFVYIHAYVRMYVCMYVYIYTHSYVWYLWFDWLVVMGIHSVEVMTESRMSHESRQMHTRFVYINICMYVYLWLVYDLTDWSW